MGEPPTQHMLCTTATASVTVCSWAVTERDQGNNLHSGKRHADTHAGAHHRLCARVTRLARRPACPPVAQQLSICQSLSNSCRPRGPQKSQRIGTRRLSTAEDVALQVTGLAGAPSLPARRAASLHYNTWTYVYLTCCTVAPAISRPPCGCGCADCRTVSCGWFWAAVPLLRLTFCIQGYPSCFMFLRDCQAGGCPVAVSQRQRQRAAQKHTDPLLLPVAAASSRRLTRPEARRQSRIQCYLL